MPQKPSELSKTLIEIIREVDKLQKIARKLLLKLKAKEDEEKMS